MQPTPATLGGGLHDGLWWLADVAFRWIPATVEVASGKAPFGPYPAFDGLVAQPVSITDLVNYLQTTGTGGTYSTFELYWGIWVTLATIISLLAAAGIIYTNIRLSQLRRIEALRFEASAKPVAARDVSRAQLRWNRIMEQVHSDSEQNWRLAILEADILLNELLDVLGYKGETMADKMKQVERADFRTIDMAWEAHKVRNEIAHQGTFRALPKTEAERVIGLYYRVLREFQFIE